MAVSEREVVTKLSVEAILQNMGIQMEESELVEHLRSIRPDFKDDEIDFELFVRVVALSLELKNFSEREDMLEEGFEEDAEEEKTWYNQEKV